MKKHTISKILSPLTKLFMAFGIIAGISSCDNAIYDYDEDCEPEGPQAEPAPNKLRIYVRSNPGSGGMSNVTDDADQTNSAETEEGIYVYVDVDELGSYTLTATETNPEYRFVRWHDDTNDGDLTEAQLVIPNVLAEASNRYTAIFEKIPEPEPEPGNYYVKYVFDRNMQFTDGFSQRVNSVELFVFNTSGEFIARYHEDGLPLKDSEYLMELTDLPAGEYELIAWCGLTGNDNHFTLPTASSITRNIHTVVTMSTSADDVHPAYQDKNLAALFHGRKENAIYVEKTLEKQIHTVYLTKNTNNINITLQHKDGLEFPKERFTVTMHDQNDIMRHDNSMHPDVQTIQYRPYRTAYGTTAASKSRADETSTTAGNYLQVELATARLMTDNNPTISVVDNETGKNIFSIPLVKWALQLRSSNYKSMDDQEYLDREDNFNLMLWLDSNDEGWFGAEININDWHVIDDSADIK